MLWTLQKYIFREMGKTFILTAVGLIVVIGLGGGVMNMIDLEGASAVQLLRIVALILPIAAILTLPIAALYSATVTYGRLSADNEFVACRSGGINIHLLFLPTVVISLLSAVCSFYFINFMIPNMVMNIDKLVDDDLPRIIKQKLTTADRFRIRDKYVIYAEKTELVEPEPETTDSPALRLSGVAFVEMDEDNWTRIGTAKSVLISFSEDGGGPTVGGDMYGISVYDAKANRYINHGHQATGQVPIPLRIPIRIKWLTLGGLLRYAQQPSLFPKVGEDLQRLRAGMTRAVFFRSIIHAFTESVQLLRTHGEIVLESAERRVVIRCRRLDPDPRDSRPVFSDQLSIEVREQSGETRRITADSAVIRLNRARTAEDLRFYVQAHGNVTIEDPGAPSHTIRRQRTQIDTMAIPADVLQRVRNVSDDELLRDDGRSLGLGSWVDEKRQAAADRVSSISREILSEIHSRTALSVSVFVLVILGAALGIVFRGAQALIAFGISFVPSLFVISSIIMGKQLIDKPETIGTGIAVVWAGIALVAVVDVIVLAKVVRR